MISARTVATLGLSQLICWGVSYYMIGSLGDTIVADTGWEPTFVYGGFSVALVMMGIVSPLVGHMIDR